MDLGQLSHGTGTDTPAVHQNAGSAKPEILPACRDRSTQRFEQPGVNG